MSEFLRLMARSSERRAREARQREPEAVLRRRAAAAPPAPSLRLGAEGFDLIAEVKLRSPSAGRLAPAGGRTPAGPSTGVARERLRSAAGQGPGRPPTGGAWPSVAEPSPAAACGAPGVRTADEGEAERVVRQARAYERGGAAAISVLTEPEAFDGDLRHLEAAAAAVALPVMRKDFLADPYQLFEARAAGAAGALLVVRILDEGRLREMVGAAGEAGLFVLMEAFDEEDLARVREHLAGSSARVGPPAAEAPVRRLVGINARDLATLDVAPSRLAALVPTLPAGAPAVAESGIESPGDARRVASLGYRLALVGTALMRTPDPAAASAAFVAAGREGARERTGRPCASA